MLSREREKRDQNRTKMRIMKAENLIIPAKMRRKDMFQNEMKCWIENQNDPMFDYGSKTLNTP